MAFHQLEQIYHKHRQGLFTFALTLTGCRSTAEDVVHQAFSRLSDARLQDKNDPVAFVFRCVRNNAIDSRRKRKRHHSINQTIFNGFVPPPAATFENPDCRVLTEERDQILRSAIDQLPENVRETVLLKAFSGLTFEQVGTVLDIPSKTAATQYRRALTVLHEKLKGQL